MKIYSKQDARNHMIGSIRQGLPEDTDNDGQIVFYSGIYRWTDGSLHDDVEPKKEEPVKKCSNPAGCINSLVCNLEDRCIAEDDAPEERGQTLEELSGMYSDTKKE